MGEKDRRLGRLRRRQQIRKKVFGTPDRPRLCVFRSLRHIYAQIIDDTTGHTLIAASTLDTHVREELGEMKKTAQAEVVGRVLARRALEKGVTTVVFDRGGYKYHGRVKALAEAARKAGLEF
ncbi:MAG: 50S ribosomal protein L18 [Anaerolineae bacterium]|nr:50S ribosomal protein L18 [Anaerolineae bacterium]